MDVILRGDLPLASKPADIYACGLVFCTILTGERTIYEATNQTLLSLFLLKLTLPPTHFRDHASGRSGEVIIDAIQDSFDEEVGAEILQTLRRCYSTIAAQRPTGRELLEEITALDLDEPPPIAAYADPYLGSFLVGTEFSLNGAAGPPIIDCEGSEGSDA
jgi:hypothetical protein